MASRKFFESLFIVVGMFLVFFVITFIGYALIVEYFNINPDSRFGTLSMSVFQNVVMFIVPSLIAARIISRQPLSFLDLNRAPGWLPSLGVIFAYLISIPALNQIIFWNENIVFPESLAYWGEIFREMEDKALATSSLMLNVSSVGDLFINLAIIALLTAFGEEIFFRGALQKSLSSSGANHAAIWIVAVFFSFMHFQAYGFIPRLLMGAWFGYLLFWTRSLYVPVLAHFINNGVVVFVAWLNANGHSFNSEMFGVTEVGFPMPAFISALAFIIFVVYFRHFFFQRSSSSLIVS